MIPSVGRIVHYKLSADDVQQINRRRTDGATILRRIQNNLWPEGVQAHVGNAAKVGDVFPMIIVKVWGDAVNGQVFLDGSDVFWTLSVEQGTSEGTWCEPPRVAPTVAPVLSVPPTP